MSNREAIFPPGHTKPIGRYSPGVAVSLSTRDRVLFISGQVATDSGGRTVAPGDPTGQTEYVFDKITAILTAADGTLRDLVALTIYLTDLSQFEQVSSVRNRRLSDPAPSSTLVEVASLAIPDHLVEISAIAVIPGGVNR